MTPRTSEGGTTHYDIVVRSPNGTEEVYRTQQLLAGSGHYYPMSRGTRVWKAIKLESGKEVGTPVALKDAWVDVNRAREGATSASVLEYAVSDAHQTALHDSLLTVLTHGDVFVAGVRDCTRPLPTGEETAYDAVPSCPESPEVRRMLSWRSARVQQVHYRVVHEQIGVPLGEFTSLKTVFGALRDACGGSSSHITVFHRLKGFIQVCKHYTDAVGSTVISAYRTSCFSTVTHGS